MPLLRIRKLSLASLSALAVLLLSSPSISIAQQAQDPQQALDDLVSMIQSKETQFRLPTTELTETIGTLDLSHGVNGENLGELFTYAPGIPTSQDGSFDIIGIPLPRCEINCRPGGLPGARIIQVPKVGANLTEVNVKNLTLRIAIKPPQGTPRPGAAIKIHLGPSNQPDLVLPITATEAVFPDVVGDSIPFWIEIDGFRTGFDRDGLPTVVGEGMVRGLNNITLNRPIVGAGALVLPVVPVSIIYAPIVDSQKKNTASFSTSHVAGNTTTIGFLSQHSETTPIASTFQSTIDTEKDMATTGAALQKVPNPYVQAAGVALSFIASGMGSSTATQTIATTVTTQSSINVSEGSSNALNALASAGGPGVSDIIAYYPKVRVVWYSKDGSMQLAVLGSEPIVYTSAQRLKDALACLKQTPVCSDFPSKYQSLQLDADAITSLLALDPFVAGGPKVALDPTRFVLKQSLEFSGFSGSKNYSDSVKISATDTKGSTKTTTDVQKDTPGFLAFLGIGITQDDTLQSQIGQSASTQASSDDSMTESYVMNGDGNEYYATEVYLDTAYGSFAFRDVTTNAPAPVINGVVADVYGNPVGHAQVTAIAGQRKFITLSNETGKFTFRLPGVKSGHVKLQSDEATANTEIGATAATVRLQRK